TLVITKGPATVTGENFAHTTTEEPPSQIEEEKADMDTKEAVEKQPTKEAKVEKNVQEPIRASRAIPISIVRPLMRLNPELEIIRCPSTIKITNTVLK
ncbi:hypothetical protein Tco_0562812, partial [Tanacetum coccineum]